MKLVNPTFSQLKLSVGDIGAEFSSRLDNGLGIVNLSGVQIITADVVKSDGKLLIKNLSVSSDNKVVFTFASGDLDICGHYRLQVFSQFSTANATHTDIFPFRVGASLI